MASEDPETRFLRNQEARTAARHKHTKSHDVHTLWRDLREKLKAWHLRVDDIVGGEGRSFKAASERQQALHDLETLEQKLKIIQKEALSELELPVSDLRLLHNEFSQCNQKLHEAREVVCPPTRFVFARYRAAWKEWGMTEAKLDEPAIQSKRDNVAQGRVIQDLTNVNIEERGEGSIFIVSPDGTVSPLEVESRESTSLVLQNLISCHITLNAHYQLLHLVNLKDCTVKCSNRVDGAIHITNCVDTNLYASCHQLRIHDATRLHCHVQVGSGPILEDSTEVRFYSNDATIKETKDFNWFRSEPSPNFEIIPVAETQS